MAALRAVGCLVQSLAAIGDGVPDIMVASRGRIILLEIKDGNKPPSERKLTDCQRAWHDRWSSRVPVYVACSVTDALALCT